MNIWGQNDSTVDGVFALHSLGFPSAARSKWIERGEEGEREEVRKREGGRGREGREMNRTMRKYRIIGIVSTG